MLCEVFLRILSFNMPASIATHRIQNKQPSRRNNDIDMMAKSLFMVIEYSMYAFCARHTNDIFFAARTQVSSLRPKTHFIHQNITFKLEDHQIIIIIYWKITLLLVSDVHGRYNRILFLYVIPIFVCAWRCLPFLLYAYYYTKLYQILYSVFGFFFTCCAFLFHAINETLVKFTIIEMWE